MLHVEEKTICFCKNHAKIDQIEATNRFRSSKIVGIGYRAPPQSGGGKVPPPSFGCAFVLLFFKPAIVMESLEEGNDVRGPEETNERMSKIATAIVIGGKIQIVKVGDPLLAHELDQIIRVQAVRKITPDNASARVHAIYDPVDLNITLKSQLRSRIAVRARVSGGAGATDTHEVDVPEPLQDRYRRGRGEEADLIRNETKLKDC